MENLNCVDDAIVIRDAIEAINTNPGSLWRRFVLMLRVG